MVVSVCNRDADEAVSLRRHRLDVTILAAVAVSDAHTNIIHGLQHIDVPLPGTLLFLETGVLISKRLETSVRPPNEIVTGVH